MNGNIYVELTRALPFSEAHAFLTAEAAGCLPAHPGAEEPDA